MDNEVASVLASRLNASLEAIAVAIQTAAEFGSAAAIERLANYLNDCDAVEQEDIEHYEQWVAKGRK